MRRQSWGGANPPAGSGCATQPDPRSLPARFAVADAAADGRMRTVEIDRERVLLRRSVCGVHMRFNIPLSTFLGVAVRALPAPGNTEGAIAIVLEHRDPALSLPLYFADDGERLVADWQLWANALSKPLLIADGEGRLREPFAHIGGVVLGETVPRRSRRTALRARRPKIFRRRATSQSFDAMLVHRGEREIIAPE